MKRNYPLLIFILAFIAVLSGNLTAGISLAARFGVIFFYKEYRFFKVWWQAAPVCFILLMTFTLILFFIDKKLRIKTAKTIELFFLLACFAGLYFTFRDFRSTLSHRWLGERFHLGIYLYWIGFCIISLFFLATKNNSRKLQKK